MTNAEVIAILEDIEAVRMTNPTCPVCGAEAVCVDSATIYGGRSYGMIWQCPVHPEQYVGCHGDSDRPKGTLCGPEVRELRKACHREFDRLWKRGAGMSRREAYAWLAETLGITTDEAHIAMFGEEHCRHLLAALQRKETPR